MCNTIRYYIVDMMISLRIRYHSKKMSKQANC